MRTEEQIKALIKETEEKWKHILTGRAETIQINAPVALHQISVEAQLKALYWCLGLEFKSKLIRNLTDESKAAETLASKISRRKK